MRTRIGIFLLKRLLAAMKEFWRQETGETPRELPGDVQTVRLHYIEAMLPVTGIVTPIRFFRAGVLLSPSRRSH
ncbi:MAG TPA: hypothetical protein VMU43_08280 [Candidatus Acidoferrum sp.]|nr:hypothetical protein [Candidatus Acidoferrum sp.]